MCAEHPHLFLGSVLAIIIANLVPGFCSQDHFLYTVRDAVLFLFFHHPLLGLSEKPPRSVIVNEIQTKRKAKKKKFRVSFSTLVWKDVINKAHFFFPHGLSVSWNMLASCWPFRLANGPYMWWPVSWLLFRNSPHPIRSVWYPTLLSACSWIHSRVTLALWFFFLTYRVSENRVVVLCELETLLGIVGMSLKKTVWCQTVSPLRLYLIGHCHNNHDYRLL